MQELRRPPPSPGSLSPTDRSPDRVVLRCRPEDGHGADDWRPGEVWLAPFFEVGVFSAKTQSKSHSMLSYCFGDIEMRLSLSFSKVGGVQSLAGAE